MLSRRKSASMQPAITSTADAILVVISEFAYRESGGNTQLNVNVRNACCVSYLPTFDHDRMTQRVEIRGEKYPFVGLFRGFPAYLSIAGERERERAKETREIRRKKKSRSFGFLCP